MSVASVGVTQQLWPVVCLYEDPWFSFLLVTPMIIYIYDIYMIYISISIYIYIQAVPSSFIYMKLVWLAGKGMV